MTEIIEQKIVSGCKNPSWIFYIAVMHFGVWLLICIYAIKIKQKLICKQFTMQRVSSFGMIYISKQTRII